MNFLAHIYLSFDDPEITLGNFMADSIRGSQYLHYPENLQKGILLHRAIDTYTDSHPTPRKSSKRLHPRYGHYSRVIIDIYYDHFLARNWRAYSDTPLADYTESFYRLLEDNLQQMPEAVQRMAPYMISDDWLYNYRDIAGIHRVLQGMNRRTRNKSGMDTAVTELEAYYDKFESEFTSFFDELVIFSRDKMAQL